MKHNGAILRAVQELRRKIPTLNVYLPGEVQKDGIILFQCDTKNHELSTLPYLVFNVGINPAVFKDRCDNLDRVAGIPADRLDHDTAVALRIAYIILQTFREAKDRIMHLEIVKP